MNGLPDFLKFTRRRGGIVPRAGGTAGVKPIIPGVHTDHYGTGAVRERGGDGPNYSEDEQTFLPGATGGAPPRVNPAIGLDDAAPSVPDPVAAITRPTGVGPEVTGAERRDLGAAPLSRNAKGESVGKPFYDDTGDRAGDLERYRQSLSDQRNPADRDGKLKTFFKEFGQGMLEGGLLGGVARGVRGLAAPNVNERRKRDREQARVEGEQAKNFQQQGWQAKLAEAQADLELKRAQTETVRRKPEETDRRLDQIDRRLEQQDFYNQGTLDERRRSNKERERDRDDDRSVRKSLADQLNDFRKTALYARLKESEKNRQSRVSEGAKNRASREGIAARAQEGANARTATAQAGADRRALSGLRFGLVRLAAQAVTEKRSLEELVKEIEGLGGEVFDDEH